MSAWAPDRALRLDVLERHLEEAGFLWTQWEAALDDAGYTLAELAAGPEWRLRAHLDALVVAGRGAVPRLLGPALLEGEPELAFAAAFALLAEGDARDPTPVLAALAADADPERRRAVLRAFALCESPRAGEPLVPLLAAGDDALCAGALDALAFRRAAPPADVMRLLAHRTPAVRAAAFRAVRRLPGGAPAEAVRAALADRDEGVREAGLAAGLVAGQAQAFRACRELAALRGPLGRTARAALACCGGDEEAAALGALLADETLRRDALFALGHGGRVGGAEACLPFLDDDALGGVAAEAFAAITGLPLAPPYLRDPPPPRDEELPPLDEDLETELSLPEDDDLPLVHAPRAAAWWAEARKALDPGVRLLRGKPFDLGPLRDELASGPARRRHVLALELAIRSRGAAQIETRAFAAVQRAQLEAAAAVRGGTAFARPFGERAA
jgi:uncharacterized protein (TIGR02270 family)